MYVAPLDDQLPRDAGETAGRERRRDDAPSMTQKTLLPVPSQRLPARLAKTASVALRSAAWASATTFSPYDVVLRPASAPRSLRGHGTVATAVRRPAVRIVRRRRLASAVVAAAGAQRRRPAGVGDPDAAQGCGSPSSTAATPRTDLVVVGLGQPEALAERASRSQVAGQGEGRSSTTLIASKTPSPTVKPWSGQRSPGLSGSSQRCRSPRRAWAAPRAPRASARTCAAPEAREFGTRSDRLLFLSHPPAPPADRRRT